MEMCDVIKKWNGKCLEKKRDVTHFLSLWAVISKIEPAAIITILRGHLQQTCRMHQVRSTSIMDVFDTMNLEWHHSCSTRLILFHSWHYLPFNLYRDESYPKANGWCSHSSRIPRLLRTSPHSSEQVQRRNVLSPLEVRKRASQLWEMSIWRVCNWILLIVDLRAHVIGPASIGSLPLWHWLSRFQ